MKSAPSSDHRRALAAVGCALLLGGMAAGQAEVSYRVGIEPREDRTALRVVMEFDGDADGTSRIALPADRYGTPRIWESIVGLAVEGGELRPVDGEPSLRDVLHEPGARVTLRYTMARDPDADDGVAYRPSVGPEHFHFFDAQWRCRLVGSEQLREFAVSFAEVPEGWTVFSNLGPGSGPYRVTATDRDLEVFLAGGDYAAARFEVGGRPIGVYVRGPFGDRDGIVASVRDIVRQQGELFGGFAGEFYAVSLSPREGITAGTAIDNAFVCLTDPDASRENLDVLIAHEVFHNWLPRTAAITSWRSGEPIDEFRFDWFLEGFTEFIARRMLLDAGALDLDRFVERFNRDLHEQARNSMRRASLEVVREALAEGRYTNAHERTSYFRGPLIALSWDRQLRSRGEHTLFDLVRAFIAAAVAAGGTIDQDAFFDLVAGFGIDGRADYLTHIVHGDPPRPEADVFGPEYAFEPLVVPTVDQGFDVLSSRRSGVVRGVVLDGPAYLAGLRDGMELIESRTSRSPERPTTLRVRSHGVERSLEYLPAGDPVLTGQWVRRR